MQYLRDKFEINIPNKGPTSILGTYPLKISFMKAVTAENFGPANTDNELGEVAREKENCKKEFGFDDMSELLVDVLKDVEDKGQDQSLTSFFVKDEPILLESDKCYVESRRIMQYLMNLNDNYLYHGRIHTFVVLLFLACCAGLFGRCVYGMLYFVPHPTKVEGSEEHCVNMTIIVAYRLSFYLFWHLPASFLVFVEMTLCWIGVFMLRRLWHDKKPLYDLYKGILYVYIAFWIISIVLLGIGIALGVLYRYAEGCRPYFPSFLHYLMVTTILVTLLPLLYTCLHLTITCYEMKFQYSKFEVEWIFFDRLWQDCCYKLFSCKMCRKNFFKYSDRYQSRDTKMYLTTDTTL